MTDETSRPNQGYGGRGRCPTVPWRAKRCLLLAILSGMPLTSLSCTPPSVGGETWKGSAIVVIGERWVGTETQVVVGDSGDVLCEQSYALAGAPTQDCEDCTFAFDLQVSDVEHGKGIWCGQLGIGAEPYPCELSPRRGYSAETQQFMYFNLNEWSDARGVDVSWTGDDTEGDLNWDWNYAERYYAID